MCLVVFLGTDAVLDTTEWSKEDPSFYIGRPSQYQKDARLRLRAPRVYSLGSHTGCGCGFGFGETYADGFIDPEEAESRRQLAEHLRTLIDAGHSAEILVCWSGDERVVPTRRLHLPPEAFMDSARIAEGDLVTLTSSLLDFP